MKALLLRLAIAISFMLCGFTNSMVTAAVLITIGSLLLLLLEILAERGDL